MHLAKATKELNKRLEKEDRSRHNVTKALGGLRKAFHEDMVDLRDSIKKDIDDAKKKGSKPTNAQQTHVFTTINDALQELNNADHFAKHGLESHFRKALEGLISLLQQEKSNLLRENTWTDNDVGTIGRIATKGEQIVNSVLEEMNQIPEPVGL